MTRCVNVTCCTLCVLLLLAVSPMQLNAAKIIWVSEGRSDEYGDVYDQAWVDLLQEKGYEVQREDSTMMEVLEPDQIATLEEADLIIFGRGNNSGSYNDPAGWNSIGKPILLLSSYLARSSRWMWLNNTDLEGDGGAPMMEVLEPDHAIFKDVELDAYNMVTVLDSTIGTGHTSLTSNSDPGDGFLLATDANFGGVWICYWPTDFYFHADTDYFAPAPRMYFSCGTREDPDWLFGWGMYNLTPEGEKIFLNIVEWMLEGETAVDKIAENPSAFQLQQNFPNPFNPETTIHFTVPKTSRVSVRVYNMLGQEIALLADAQYAAGRHTLKWDGRNNKGTAVQSGVYIYQLETSGLVLSKKMILLK